MNDPENVSEYARTLSQLHVHACRPQLEPLQEHVATYMYDCTTYMIMLNGKYTLV